MKIKKQDFLLPFKDTALTTEARPYLDEIASNHLMDLTTNVGGFFSLEDQAKITEMAALKLFGKLTGPSVIELNSLRRNWQDVAQDFHSSNHWGFVTQPKSPVVPLNTQQKTHRELFSYVWVLVQAAIIMKVVVYFFGIQASNDPTWKNYLLVGFAFAVSVGSLFYFAWRKSRKEKV